VSTQKVKRIKILRIIARMNVGGPAVQISGLMRHFNNEEFNQILVTGYCDATESDYLDTSATDVQATRIRGLGKSINLLGDLKAFFELRSLIKEFRPDIVHTHTAKAGVLGRIASLTSGHKSKRVHTFHGHLLVGYFGALKTQLIIIIEKTLALFTHKIFAVGEKVQSDLIDAGIAPALKFVLMPPGLELRKIPTHEEALRLLGLDSTKTYCSFIGRLTTIKRPDRFLDVVQIVAKELPNLEFIVAGAGELMDQCMARVQKDNLPVTFLGWREDIETIMAASDFTILTSDNEGMPLSLIQAALVGVPGVSTNVGAVSDIIQNGISGFVTELNVQALAKAVSDITRYTPQRLHMGQEAKKWATERFSVHRLVNDHQVNYKELLEG
jgi:glycosyltransferase involved in cell wall biosynthesis